MSRAMIVRCTAALLLLLGAWADYTQNQSEQPPQLNLNKVKDNRYEIEGDGGNALCISPTKA